MGVHHPTDILGGTAIGVAIACLAQPSRVRHLLAIPALGLSQRQPALFYSCAFVLTSEMTVLFTDVRNIGSNIAVLSGT